MKLVLLQAARLAGLTAVALTNVSVICPCSGACGTHCHSFRVAVFIKDLVRRALLLAPFVAGAAASPDTSQVSTAVCTRKAV